MCGDHPRYPARTETVEHPILPGITDTRLDRFFWGPYASQHLDKLLERARYDGAEHVSMSYWSAPGDSKPPFSEATQHLENEARPLNKGHVFVPSWSNHWVKVDLTIPEELRGSAEEVIFEFDPSAEALIFLPDETPLHGITGGPDTAKDGVPGWQEDRRVEHVIPQDALRAGQYSIIIEVSCNGMFGIGTDGYRYQVPDPHRKFPLVSADIVLPDYRVRNLRTDFRILTQVARHPDVRTSGLAQKALEACNTIMNTFRRREDEAFMDDVLSRCRHIAWEVLGPLDKKAIAELCVHKDTEEDAQIWAIGHCHIDTAWLWRYTQTQQKVARSWTTQCDLMDRWPNHQFAASSAQQYLWLEELYPKGFAHVKKYIEEGRFHAVGGAWLEHDCMIPSGESLVRQYLYGQRYFKSRFGRYCREAWLPDTFGYASQLPQILRLAGLSFFFTQKMSWNNINAFPYSTFNWSGIDGTQVLAHMTPVDSYNAQCNFPELMKGVSKNKNLGITDQCLLLFGNGDGGGGPTPKMLEKLERLGALSKKNPEVPSLKMGGPAAFFDTICRKSDAGRKLPTWRGELYFEFHRGTYTTQANVKKGNREMETLLRDLEYFATLASLDTDTGGDYVYPRKELDEMWQDTLLGQFHDCLPGTTINSVVQDNLNIYAERGAQARQLIDEALAALCGDETDSTTTATGAEWHVVDPLRLARQQVVEHSGKLQLLTTDDLGIGALSSPSSLDAPSARSEGDVHVLENANLRLTISQGRIASLFDKSAKRELILPGPRAEDAGWVIFEDYPLAYDAWDTEVYHLGTCEPIRFDVVQVVQHPLRASLVTRARFGESEATLTISLDATSPSDTTFTPNLGSLIRLDAHIDWHEQHRFLKFALPLDIHAPNATYGTQFGLVERPTHRNTTWDQAKFECCAHGFADLSEHGYGVAIAARDKYGYAVEGNVMRLSCLRSSTSPDPVADQGEHDFSFAIIPHRGHFNQSDVVLQAMRFNNRPYIISAAPRLGASFIIEGPHSDGLVLETIKRGEDDDSGGKESKSVILRLYEAKGGRATGALKIRGLAVKSATWVNILEEVHPDVASEVSMRQGNDGVDVEVNARCFEIKTLKLDLA